VYNDPNAELDYSHIERDAHELLTTSTENRASIFELFEALKGLLNGYMSRYATSPIFHALRVMVDENGEKSIGTDYVKALNESAKDELMRDWALMYNDSRIVLSVGSHDYTVREFAELLAAYSVNNSGYTTTGTSFHNYIPLAILNDYGVTDNSLYDAKVEDIEGVIEGMSNNSEIVTPVRPTLKVDPIKDPELAAVGIEESDQGKWMEVPVTTQIKLNKDSLAPDILKFNDSVGNLTRYGNPTSFNAMNKLFVGYKFTPNGQSYNEAAYTYTPVFKKFIKVPFDKVYHTYRNIGFKVVKIDENLYKYEPIYAIIDTKGSKTYTEFTHWSEPSIFNNQPNELSGSTNVEIINTLKALPNKSSAIIDIIESLEAHNYDENFPGVLLASQRPDDMLGFHNLYVSSNGYLDAGDVV
jgi:hypothetical protein